MRVSRAVFCACAAWLLMAAAPCRVDLRASVAVTQAGGVLLVPVTLNGSTVDFVLDTGAERTAVGTAAAERLHIARDEWVSTDIQGAGGRDQQRLGRPTSLSFGGIALKRRTVAADTSVVIGPVPDSVGGRSIAGLLGQDFLSAFDLDLDVAGGVLKLYDVSGCRGRFLPWTGPYGAIPAWRPVRNVLALPMRVGSTAIQAELDSGAGSTVITLPGMLALGLASGGADMVRGFGKGSLAARTQHFPAVQIGGLRPEPADLVIAPIRTLRSIGALLGADWVVARHVWISWATDQVFVGATSAR
jgi:hypothetical protein